MANYNDLIQILSFFLVAWFVYNLNPLQRISEHWAENYGFYNVFIYPLFSCFWCATLWSELIGLSFNLHLPTPLIKALACSFIVKLSISIYERFRINA